MIEKVINHKISLAKKDTLVGVSGIKGISICSKTMIGNSGLTN
ncbi:hypothetical protein SAMN04488587_1998 [Methanococcoides vulcani]|uniref:Uncharacterized protein n=1 Tax=Methanococcoides vulcani TaxID=1353158 RepID=A0A1I0B6A0_9EURY|nr:hypothetical protein SAMN04488587_1998 [Methanococcoides vulcani]